jgi:hypothetical protein
MILIIATGMKRMFTACIEHDSYYISWNEKDVHSMRRA